MLLAQKNPEVGNSFMATDPLARGGPVCRSLHFQAFSMNIVKSDEKKYEASAATLTSSFWPAIW
jgi:hypothetical protein